MDKDYTEDRASGSTAGGARICVIGVGGAGCKIASMLYGKMPHVGVIAINTDRKSLDETVVDRRLYICKEVTKGLGTRGDPALGKKCAQIHEEEILEAVSRYDVALIVAGMGGGTGTGAASVVAELCDRAGLITEAFVIMPFSFESNRIVRAAEGYRALHAVCKTLLRFENDATLGQDMTMAFDQAFSVTNNMVVKAITSAAEDLAEFIKIDFRRDADSVDSDKGREDTSSGSAIAVPVPYF